MPRHTKSGLHCRPPTTNPVVDEMNVAENGSNAPTCNAGVVVLTTGRVTGGTAIVLVVAALVVVALVVVIWALVDGGAAARCDAPPHAAATISAHAAATLSAYATTNGRPTRRTTP
jgi:hypothetical protein